MRNRVVRHGGGETAAGRAVDGCAKGKVKAKADAAADLTKQQQAKAEDRAAAQYFAQVKAEGKVVPAPQMAAAKAPANPAKAVAPAKKK